MRNRKNTYPDRPMDVKLVLSMTAEDRDLLHSIALKNGKSVSALVRDWARYHVNDWLKKKEVLNMANHLKDIVYNTTYNVYVDRYGNIYE